MWMLRTLLAHVGPSEAKSSVFSCRCCRCRWLAASDLHPLSSLRFFSFLSLSLFFFASCTRVTILSWACDFPLKSIIRGDMVPGEEVRWPLKQWEDALVSWYQGQPVVSSIESTLKTPSSSIRIMLIVTAAAAAACVATDQWTHMYEKREELETNVITCFSLYSSLSCTLISDLCWQSDLSSITFT